MVTNSKPTSLRKRRPDAPGELIGVRVQPGLLDMIDQFRARTPAIPSRPTAIRMLVEAALMLDEAMRPAPSTPQDGVRAAEQPAVLILESDPLYTLTLRLIAERSGCRVAGIAANQEGALQIAHEHKIGLILAETVLGDLLGERVYGIDIVNAVLESVSAPVIFVTAYPERWLTGDHPEPSYLIAKPISPATVQKTIEHALDHQRNVVPPFKQATAPKPA